MRKNLVCNLNKYIKKEQKGYNYHNNVYTYTFMYMII